MTQTINQFVNRSNIRMSCDWADTNPNIDPKDWARGTSHFRCTFRRGRKQMSTYFSQGPAIAGEPKAVDVLDCLASDAAGIDNARHFEDWCGEYGYDTDSRKAERIYEACRKQAMKLENFLGAELYQALLFETERE
jgi:hypothetical protein